MCTMRPLALAVFALLSSYSWADATAPAAHAGENAAGAGSLTQTSPWHFSGFGTVGAVVTNNGNAQLRSSPNQPNGADTHPGTTPDTKLGLQASYAFTPQLTATVQVLTTQTYQNNYTPEIKWANLKYDITPNLSVRGGRIGAPLFIVSDYLKVGYSQLMVRPPLEVYFQVPIEQVDGVDAIWRLPLSDSTLTFQPYYGYNHFNLPGGFEGSAKKVAGLNINYEVGSWNFRAGFTQAQISVTRQSVTDLMNQLRLFGQSTLANELAYDSKRSSFAGLGATYDDGKLIFLAEYTQRRADSYLAHTDGWYTTLGYRIGEFTPYVSYSKIRPKDRNQANQLPTAYQSIFGPPIAYLTQGYDQHDTAAGLRWDFHKNLDAKFQFDHYVTSNTSGNTFAYTVDTNYRSPFPGQSVNAYSLAVDFIF